ncbi:MAG: hypothetical protein ASARMPRED_002776 [Alectoria sarmentosa]|nr:MAG: hypothetical protein ASARMPRED_002776 [Alectoria sarmentosa]
MKTTYAYTSIVLALIGAGDVLAHTHHHHSRELIEPTSTLSLTASSTATAFPTVSAPANSTYGGNSTTGGSPITAGSCDNCDGVCVTFGATSDDLWYWWNGGPGGDPSTFGENQIGPVCLTDGGAMFVGSSNNVATGGGNTKFEWSVGASFSNFDVSVCDGFSVPMTCTGFGGNESPYVTIGGGELCASDCPSADEYEGNCRNLGAHTGSLAEVPSCFQEGAGAEGEDGTNNYWLYDNYSVQAIFTGRTDVVCTVGATSSKAKRGDVGHSAAELGPRASKHRQHGHQRRAHGHGLNVVS